jgi:hypothetical protein
MKNIKTDNVWKCSSFFLLRKTCEKELTEDFSESASSGKSTYIAFAYKYR